MSLVYPVLAQVLLTLLLFLKLGQARVAAVRSRQVRVADIALSADAYPENARKLSNNVGNQFQTPVLFYVLGGVATYVGATGFPMTLLAWAYVATRVAHSAIHVSYNRVQHRFLVFLLGLVVLVLMFIGVVVRLIAA